MDTSDPRLFSILERIVQHNAPYVDDKFLSMLLQHLTSSDFYTRYSVNWIINTVKLWNQTAAPQPLIFDFAVRLVAFVAKKESNFNLLNHQNVIKTLLSIGESMETNVTVSFLDMVSSFCEHNAGITFVKDSGLWMDIILSIQSQDTTDGTLVSKGYDTIATLLMNSAEDHTALSAQVIKLVTDPIINAAHYIQNEDSNVFHSGDRLVKLTPNIVSTIEILERLLEKLSLNVLKIFLTLKLEAICESLALVSTNEKLCLDLGRIAIILSFYRMIYYFDGIKVVNRDGVTLECFTRIFKKEVEKGHVKTAFKYCSYAQKYWKNVKERMPKYYSKGKPIEVEDQLMAMLMVPLVKFIKIVNSAAHVSYTYHQDLHAIYTFSMFNKVSVNTFYSCVNLFNFLDNFPLFEIEYLVLECLIECKNYFSQQNAGLIFQLLMYTIKEFLIQYIREPHRTEISEKALRFVTRLLEALIIYIEYFNLSWKDSVATIFGNYLAVGFLTFDLWPPELIVKGLVLLNMALKKNMSPTMTLLVDSTNNSSLVRIGPILRFKCCHDNWEVRKTALEVVYTVALKASNLSSKSNEKFPSFKNILTESSIVELVFNMALNDCNLFVRAKAMECLQRIIAINDVGENLLRDNCLQTILQAIGKEEEGIVRKEAIALVTKIYKYYDNSEYDILRIYNAMEYAANNDPNMGVKINSLKFWKKVIFKHLENQGMTDGAFPDVIFSKEEKKIVVLTNHEVRKRLGEVMTQLSYTGCFSIFVNVVKDATIPAEVLNVACKSLTQFSQILYRYKVTKEDIKFIPRLQACLPTDFDEIEGLMEELIKDTNVDILGDLESAGKNQSFMLQLENEFDAASKNDFISSEDFLEFLYKELPSYVAKSKEEDDFETIVNKMFQREDAEESTYIDY